MKNVPMRFAGYTFRHNPSKLTIEDEANVVGVVSPCTPPDSTHLGRGLRIIRGEGELYGADCIMQYRGIRNLYLNGEKGLLSLPHMPPMTAYLRELRLIAEPREDELSFTFTFIETQGKTGSVDDEAFYTVAADGESLWDIAFAHGLDIDTLVMLNPQICCISELDEGEKVRLC